MSWRLRLYKRTICTHTMTTCPICVLMRCFWGLIGQDTQDLFTAPTLLILWIRNEKTDLAIPILNGHYVNHQAKEKLPNLCPLCWHAACAQWRRAVGSSGRLVTTGSQCVFGATRSNGDQRTWVPAYRRVRNLWPNLCPDAEAFVRQ